MGTFKTGDAWAAGQMGRARRIYSRMVLEHAAVAGPLKRKARQALSGNLSTALLRKLGHPFGRGNGRGDSVQALRSGGRRRKVRTTRTRVPVPKLPINRQTGNLRRSLIIETKGAAGSKVSTLRFMARYAKWVLALDGTSKMVARGFWQRMIKEHRREYAKVLKAAADEFRKG